MSKTKRYWLRSQQTPWPLWWIWDGVTGNDLAMFDDEETAKAELKRMNAAASTPPPPATAADRADASRSQR